MVREVLDQSKFVQEEREPIPGSVGFVFSGQGLSSRGIIYKHAQALSAINPSIVNKNFRLMQEVSNSPLLRYIFDRDEEVLDGTHVVQAMVHALHLSVIELLEPQLSDSKQVCRIAGHSAGEVAAMVAAGIFTPEDSVVFMAKRGKFLHEESVRTKSGLIIPLGFNLEKTDAVIEETKSITGLQQESIINDDVLLTMFQNIAKKQEITLEELLEQLSLKQIISIALMNEPSVNVIGGTKLALGVAEEISLRNGARRVLQVDAEGAFHTEVMQPAAERLSKLGVELQKSRHPLVLNNGAISTNPQEIIKAHIGRMTQPVRWTETMRQFGDMECVVSIDPGGKVPGVSKANGILEGRQIGIFELFQKGISL